MRASVDAGVSGCGELIRSMRGAGRLVAFAKESYSNQRFPEIKAVLAKHYRCTNRCCSWEPQPRDACPWSPCPANIPCDRIGTRVVQRYHLDDPRLHGAERADQAG
jgi:hypothetical protein